MSLKVYFDLMSQPSRALYILLKQAKCKFEPVLVDLRRLEHHSEEYTKINRMQKVPVIEHNGFVLSESIAIIRYLSAAGLVPPSLYPQDLKQQARVDEFLEWHHIGLRLHCSMYFRYIYLDPIISGMKPDPKTASGYERRMRNALQEFDTLWLGRGTDFILGDKPTVADIWAACELEQPRIIGFDAKDSYPNIAAWWPKLAAALEPHYTEAHVIVNKVGKKVKLNSKM